MAGFLDLPVELRCVIYNQLGLKSDCVIEVRKMTPFTGGPDRLMSKYYCKPNLSMAIIFVNKEINAEASSILYAINRFSFIHIGVLNMFLQRPGPLVRHVRHVGYQELGSKQELKTLISLLKPAKYLTKLAISNEITDSTGWFRTYNAKQFFKLLEPPFEALREARNNQFDEKKKAISDIVSIRPTCYLADISVKRSRAWANAARDAEAVEAEMKALVAERYG